MAENVERPSPNKMIIHLNFLTKKWKVPSKKISTLFIYATLSISSDCYVDSSEIAFGFLIKDFLLNLLFPVLMVGISKLEPDKSLLVPLVILLMSSFIFLA
jgi:hypothetical protein